MRNKLLAVVGKLKIYAWLKHAGVALTFLLLLNTTVLAYNNLQTNSPVFGLKLNGRLLLGKSQQEIADLITQQARQAGPINFTYNRQKATITPQSIGLTVNLSQTQNRTLTFGRTGSPFQKLLSQEQSLLGFTNLSLSANFNPALLAAKILEIQDKFNTDPMLERPDFANDINSTLPAINGRIVDIDRLTAIVGQNIDLRGEKNFPLPTKTVAPHRHYTEQDLIPIRNQAAEILKLQNVGLVAAGEKFNLSDKDLRSMLTVVERPNPENPKDFVLELRLDNRTLNNKLGDFAATVEARNQAEFNFQYARVALYAQIFSGKSGPITISAFNVTLPQPRVLAATTFGPKIAYLTFDDGPDPIYHPLIVSILKSQAVPATFFLIGQNAQKYPNLAKDTLAPGNTINNHSLTHPFLPNLTNSSIIAELSTTNNILRLMNNNLSIRLFRPPYGGTNPTIANDAAQLGMSQVLWSVDPRDWSEPETSILVDRVVSQTVNGSIILMHSNHRATVTALPQILGELKSKGFEFRLL